MIHHVGSVAGTGMKRRNLLQEIAPGGTTKLPSPRSHQFPRRVRLTILTDEVTPSLMRISGPDTVPLCPLDAYGEFGRPLHLFTYWGLRRSARIVHQRSIEL